MTHAEFHKAVGAVANGRYFASSVTVNSHTSGELRIEWSAYIDGPGWTDTCRTAEEALSRLGTVGLPKASPEALGDVAQELVTT